jgi:ribosomal protein S27E
MELGIDGIFLKMLLVSKKKYAALLYRGEGLEPKLELKGLDMVRRDWCDLMKYASYYTICQFMNSENDVDTAVDKVLRELKRVSDMLNDDGNRVDSIEAGVEYSDDIKEIMKARGKLILDHITPKMLAITKVLKQDLSTYGAAESMPHVKAAKYMVQQHKVVEKGASISYIVVDTGKLSASESEDENIQTPAVKAEKHADVLPATEVKAVHEADIKYYLESQLYNTIKRLCMPFGGCIDPSMIANALGVTYISPSVSNEQEQEQSTSFVPHTKEIVIKCPYCDNEITITKNPLFYTQCSKCNEEINTFSLHNLILYQIRKYLRENNGSHLESRGIFQKEIETCQLPLSTLNVAISTTPLSLKTSSTDIFNNLRYFAYLFEPLSDKMRDEIVKAKPDFNFIRYESFSEEMLVQARKFLNMHAFSHINFFKLLSKARGMSVVKAAETEEVVKEEQNDESASEQEDSVVESEDEEI